MNKLFCCLTLALALAATAQMASASDRIRLTSGAQSSGDVAGTSATKVSLQIGATTKEFAVNEIESISFDGEPNQLFQARIAVRGGRYDDAVAMLAKIDPRALKRAEIVKDVQFYQAVATARLALAGTGSIVEAGKKMLAFERANPDSHHHFEACETVGDLLAALGRYADAETYYNRLAEAPWPEYKMRAGVLVGRALVSQKEYDRAVAAFDKVLGDETSGPQADAQRMAARLGKASALSGGGRPDEAVALVSDVIAKADPEDEELYARAYNILGSCHRAAGKKKEALLDFLHVDLLYARFAEQHAEALSNLATLWAEVDKADRAAQAKNMLQEKYPGSAAR